MSSGCSLDIWQLSRLLSKLRDLHTNWSKMKIEALCQHLIDMDNAICPPRQPARTYWRRLFPGAGSPPGGGLHVYIVAAHAKTITRVGSAKPPRYQIALC